MSKISIIIPVYNAEKYLKMTLDSIINQTFNDFEVICVNDGSTDNSLNILQYYNQKDSRFKIYNQENKGGSISRNNGLSVANGEYIAFIDNDDIYHPQYLEYLYNNIKKYNADICCCSYIRFNGYENYHFKEIYKESNINFITKNPFIDKFKKGKKIENLMWTKLYRRELLKNIRFSEQLPAINDILFNIEVLLSASSAVVLNQKLIAYRIINTSQTMSKLSSKRINEYKNLALEIKKLIQKYPKYAKILEKIIIKYVYGMFYKEVIQRYDIKQEKDIIKQIKVNLDYLIDNKIINIKKLGVIKRVIFKKFIKKCNDLINQK